MKFSVNRRCAVGAPWSGRVVLAGAVAAAAVVMAFAVSPARAQGAGEAAQPRTELGTAVEGVPTYVEPGGAAPRQQMIAAGDTVRVVMVEDAAVGYEGEVSASGTIPVPYFGEFPIVGLTASQAADKLAEALEEGLYQKATVSVVLLSKGPGTVYIYGAVQQPGGIPVPKYGNLTILRAILLASGLSNWAAPEETFILRRPPSGGGQVERISVNLSEIFATAIPQSAADLPLIDGDIICIPGVNGELHQFLNAADREIIIVGEVGNPGPVRFSPGESRSLLRALFKAGGFSQFAKKTAVKIIRYGKNQERSEMIVNAEEIMEEGLLHKDIDLQPGDMLIVPAKRVNF